MATSLPPHHPVCFGIGKQQPFLPHPGINGAHASFPCLSRAAGYLNPTAAGHGAEGRPHTNSQESSQRPRRRQYSTHGSLRDGHMASSATAVAAPLQGLKSTAGLPVARCSTNGFGDVSNGERIRCMQVTSLALYIFVNVSTIRCSCCHATQQCKDTCGRSRASRSSRRTCRHCRRTSC